MNTYSKKLELLFLIRSLEFGGAERQLVELVKRLDTSIFHVTVATFYSEGALLPKLESLSGVRVVCLQKRGRWDTISFIGRLFRLVRQTKPHIVHGYLSVANEYALLAGKLSAAKVVWGLRASNVDFSRYDWTARLMFRIGGILSPLADLIIVNSRAGKDHHIHQGYAARHMTVIPNGIDTTFFRPDPESGRRLRREWGIRNADLLVGLVGRLDPIKDHPAFLRMAAILARQLPQTRFICVGEGPQRYRHELQALAGSLGLGTRVIWTGARRDIEAVYNSFDLLCLTSSGEGFPNVVGEAMSCGIPCVATNVGDTARLIGDSGKVVPVGDPEALARACLELLNLPVSERLAMGHQAHERIHQEFSIEKMVASTHSAFNELVSGKDHH